MATEIAKESVATTNPEGFNIHQATDAISGIINRQAEPESAPEPVREPLETPDEVPDTPNVEQEAPRMEAEEEQAEAEEPEPAKAESEVSEGDAEELELEPAQLAALLGLQEHDLILNDEGGVAVKAKVDGEATAVALNELRDSYQLTKTAQQRLTKLGEERKAFEAERSQALEKLGQQVDSMAQSIQQMEAEYSADWQSIDWNSLKRDDPTEYNLRRSEFNDRKERLNGYRAHFEQQRNEAIEKWEEQQQQLITQGQQKLDEAMTSPVYANAPKWDKDAKKELVDYMISEGVPSQLIQSSPVWQAFNWARKAMLYDKAMTEAKKTAKRVVKLPKVTKPGAQKSKTQVKQSRMNEARQRQRKAGGSLKSTADRISAIMRGS